MQIEEVKEISQKLYDVLNDIKHAGYKDGKYEFAHGVYANICTYETQPRKEKFFEAHRAYVDVQLMLFGSELVSVETVDDMRCGKCISEYSVECDSELYEMNILGKDYLLKEGEIFIFKPKDAHAPGIAIGDSKEVRKAIVKVPINLFED